MLNMGKQIDLLHFRRMVALLILSRFLLDHIHNSWLQTIKEFQDCFLIYFCSTLRHLLHIAFLSPSTFYDADDRLNFIHIYSYQLGEGLLCFVRANMLYS